MNTYYNSLDSFLLKRANSIVDSQSTASRYYIIGDQKIRISDHQPSHYVDVSIIIPSNESKQFIVSLGNNTKVFTFTINKLKQFIDSYIIINCESKTRKSSSLPVKLQPIKSESDSDLKSACPGINLYSDKIQKRINKVYKTHSIHPELMIEFLSILPVNTPINQIQSRIDKFFRAEKHIW